MRSQQAGIKNIKPKDSRFQIGSLYAWTMSQKLIKHQIKKSDDFLTAILWSPMYLSNKQEQMTFHQCIENERRKN